MEELLQRVNERFYYEDGRLFNRDDNSRSGYLNISTGYRDMKIDGFTYKEHRIIYLMHHKELPDRIDHKNRILNDNRIENLREATHSQNMANSIVYKNNISGYKGVTLLHDCNKWRARIQGRYIGLYDTAEEAARAYDLKAIEIFKDFSKLNFKEN